MRLKKRNHLSVLPTIALPLHDGNIRMDGKRIDLYAELKNKVLAATNDDLLTILDSDEWADYAQTLESDGFIFNLLMRSIKRKDAEAFRLIYEKSGPYDTTWLLRSAVSAHEPAITRLILKHIDEITNNADELTAIDDSLYAAAKNKDVEMFNLLSDFVRRHD